MTDAKTIPTELLDTLLSGYQKPEDLIGENGLLKDGGYFFVYFVDTAKHQLIIS